MDRTRPHPIDILWQPGTLLSVFAAGELLALTLVLANDAPDDRVARFGLFSFAIQWVVLATLGLLYLVRDELRRHGAATAVAFGLFALTAVTLGSIQLGWRLLGGLWDIDAAGWWLGGLRFYGALLCMALIGLLALRGQWHSRRMELRAKQADLDLLRARVNPHFLFNTLNTATALLHAAPHQAEQVLLDLADLFRAALSEQGDTSLEKEVELTRHYLQIESLRLGDRLQVDWDLPAALPAAQLPALSLQTLVENAVRHGIEPLAGGGELRIALSADVGGIVLRVENPLTPAREDTGGHQVGLAATRARIESATSGRGSLATREEDGRFIAEIRLPPGMPPGQDASR